VDLRPSEEQQQLRGALRRLYERRLSELVDALPDPPRHDPSRDLADAVAVGLPGLGLPEDVGGAGTFADLVVAHEELGRGLAGPLPVALAAAGRLLRRTTGRQRDGLLGAIADGRRTATVAHADAAGVARRVVVGPAAADVLVVITQPSGPVVLVVPTDAAGVDWQPEAAACDLPSWTVRIAEPAATTAARLALADGGIDGYRSEVAILAAARQAGAGRAVLGRTIDHVKTREQFDRAIGTFQAVQHQLADVATDLYATELAVAQSAWAVDAALAPGEVRRLAAIAALTAAAAVRRATLVAHQLHGGMGFVLDSPLHLWSARAVADPTVPMARREILDDLADASGVMADGITAPADHRLTV
jgi:alkylation response protein AidB-like acyl-CoA dehydrogenase